MKYVILGITGSWGKELTKQLLDKLESNGEIVGFSRSEFAQVEMNREINDPRVKFVIGDVRDREAVIKVTQGANVVFILSALKHIPICEEQPDEAFKTNVLGTQNVIEACKLNKVGKVLFCSTDKAANPINFYGITKAMSEKLILSADEYSPFTGLTTRFSCVRGGNVIGSRGSAIPYFIDMIKKGTIYLTNPQMTRFFMTIPHAIKLLLTALESEHKGIFIMKMKSTSLIDLVDVLQEKYGKAKIEVIGERKGEKTHEILVTPEEAKHLYHYNNDFFLYSTNEPRVSSRLETLPKANIQSYSSFDNQMKVKELKELLTEAGYL